MLEWKRWRLFHWLLLAALLYAGLWAATAWWGPAALDRQLQRKLDETEGYAGNPQVWVGTLGPASVPAPFMIRAKWTSSQVNPKQPAVRVWYEVRAVWIFGWVIPVSEGCKGIACG